jgi:DNA topoisomerase-1
MVSENLGEIDAREINSIVLGADAEGHPVVVRVGRYGPYVQRGEDRASVPEDLAPDELTVPKALQLLEAGSSDREIGVHPDSGLPILVRAGRFGPYVQVGDADHVDGKPQTASLLQSMDPATLTLADALKVLSLPRVVSQDELFTIDLPAALAIFAQPKTRRGQASAAPLRELGPDPVTGGVILLKDGRFGPYVTDGETNASLRKGDVVDAITPERAAELLADRRAAGPSTRKRAAKKAAGGAKKAVAKKAAATGAVAKKAVAKKSVAKKAVAARASASTKTATLNGSVD